MLALGLLAVALAIDAAAVSIGIGAARPRDLVAAAITFAVFQGGMSGLGAVGGAWMAEHAAAWDHWIAFALLLVVGGRMVLKKEDADADVGALGLGTLLALGVATSIDALAAGVTLPLLGPAILVSVVVIGVVTGVLSIGAGLAGRWAQQFLGVWAERAGGLVLIGIGLRILVSHLLA